MKHFLRKIRNLFLLCLVSIIPIQNFAQALTARPPTIDRGHYMDHNLYQGGQSPQKLTKVLKAFQDQYGVNFAFNEGIVINKVVNSKVIYSKNLEESYEHLFS